MTQRDNILQELQDLDSRLLNDSFANVYQVPAGYFDELPGLILRRIRAMEAQNPREELAILSPLLNSIKRATPYQLPEGYFEGLEKTGVPGLQPQEELEQLSPLLSGLNKQMPYQVPEGYFTRLDHSTVTEKAPARLISINRSWLRYAAAAVFITFITVSGFFYLNRKTTLPAESATITVKKLVDDVSTDELNEFIEATDNTAPLVATAGSSANEIKELMKNVSDKEIQDFLNDAEAIETISN